MSRWRAWAQDLGLALLPARCLVCGERGVGGQDLCDDCRAALPWNRSACARCALPLPVPAPLCGRCRRAPPPFDGSCAAFRYGFPLDRLLPRLKFHGDLAAGRLLAELAAEALAEASRPQLLLPVPLHPARLRQRGYDQALELARPLARALDLPLCADHLRRQRATAAQSELGAPARRRNVRDAFALRPGTLPAHVAVFDDVMTTGATLSECCRLLKRAGVVRVDAWAVARAPAPGAG
ncbi:ComF family protein [Arenimonas terrae]|uniref:ComF family protein n=1 Tax=Arenimonas terrae TaxID=2546226 RepID=A0A5C4RP29_9GAMM|nr:ComF family protein [Arenimonas terrae]TNJ32705.1 ComF family protein [Arenimonas terrae]